MISFSRISSSPTYHFPLQRLRNSTDSVSHQSAVLLLLTRPSPSNSPKSALGFRRAFPAHTQGSRAASLATQCYRLETSNPQPSCIRLGAFARNGRSFLVPRQCIHLFNERQRFLSIAVSISLQTIFLAARIPRRTRSPASSKDDAVL